VNSTDGGRNLQSGKGAHQGSGTHPYRTVAPSYYNTHGMLDSRWRVQCCPCLWMHRQSSITGFISVMEGPRQSLPVHGMERNAVSTAMEDTLTRWARLAQSPVAARSTRDRVAVVRVRGAGGFWCTWHSDARISVSAQPLLCIPHFFLCIPRRSVLSCRFL
jgi:hypothetical protein